MNSEPESVLTTEAPVDLSAIASMITDLAGSVRDLTARVERTETRQPQFRPMRRDDEKKRPDMRARLAGMRPGERHDETGRKLNVMANGMRVPDAVMSMMSPQFRQGDMVQINPDAIRYGSETPWGVILEKVESDGIGEVLALQYLTDRGEWKYQVRVPDLTGNARHDGFHESELLPA